MSEILQVRCLSVGFPESLTLGFSVLPIHVGELTDGDFQIYYTPKQALCYRVSGYVIKQAAWLKEGYFFAKVNLFVSFDLGSPEPIPNGTMKNAWQKGSAAHAAGANIDSYPGDKGTAPHTVWLKGYLWSYVQTSNK